ncbi:amidase [Jannaschia seohaensis]|uniref:Aspartyl-tRNA(Asn)/glutamyl-tRNA(Gln) amidotransferase subunit A n=1 Tax=Jannaschia seohaensis TaxID=475081 RepID=A0A2Y9A3V3_9RHOB|nr:amidase family protein [Jannaschia seohaensis]PWJ22268.1 aspartyl-tRNA(Asn)/glutamyl-tRNA(Gln) amidotransferase subunit A [Jannaschia seohaensis]SSA38546.1 aspartyl-tRNA(Asn)/glutamyl-tRNA(Gln) amidotransferase subunit A [Jannaschia seohaensis]
MDDWLTASGADLGRGIARGEIDPEALCEAHLAAIAAHPHRDSIFTVVTEDRARAEAAAAAERARLGLRRGPLDGVPVSWKDLFDSAGVATEAGSKLLAGRVPQTDAAVLANATHGGSVCLGKTHMSELAFSGLGLNPSTATPPNVNDAGLVPGGSSSGAAASVAFGLAPIAIGSDTGGSVRNPAAWNDLVGLKTTLHRVDVTGTVPLVESMDTIGPLCRTVEDAALALALLEGGTPADLRGANLERRRLLVLEDYTETSRDAPRAAFEAAVTRLAEAGARIERAVSAPANRAMALTPHLFSPEAYAIWRDTIEAAPDKMYPRILDRFRTGKDADAADVLAAYRARAAAEADFLAETAGFDAVLLPSSAILPPETQRLLDDDEYYVTENLMALRNTRVGNVLGLCGLTLPTGVPSCGLMALAPPMAEERLLRLGAAMEAALA